jgi:hypothetical protein
VNLLTSLFDNKVSGEETIDGRKTWRMESEPKPGYKPANKGEIEALSSRRVSWFDEEDGIRIREVSTFVRATNSFQPGTIFDLTYTKVGADWVLADALLRADVKMLVAMRGRVESRQHYSEYRRFSVDSTLTTQ